MKPIDELTVYTQKWTNRTNYTITHPHGAALLNTYQNVQEDGATAYIHCLFVDKRFRREGVATKLN